MESKMLLSAVEKIGEEAHRLSKGSNPARPGEQTKTEQLATLVSRLADCVKSLLPDAGAEGPARPPLPNS